MAENIMDSKAKELIEITIKLREKCNIQKKDIIRKNSNIHYIYNPLDYAWEPHKFYLEKYGNLGAKQS